MSPAAGAAAVGVAATAVAAATVVAAAGAGAPGVAAVRARRAAVATVVAARRAGAAVATRVVRRAVAAVVRRRAAGAAEVGHGHVGGHRGVGVGDLLELAARRVHGDVVAVEGVRVRAGVAVRHVDHGGSAVTAQTHTSTHSTNSSFVDPTKMLRQNDATS
ncbi:MAG TPA: hypothetical protein VFT59_00760 [Candidatus Saccharimonadales bacterium]|nr:hypothetical protein [Candidatus Saccharimonadales bacterium]